MPDEKDSPRIGAEQLSLLGASKGGRARAAVLTADERREIARAAARARWGKHSDEGSAIEPSSDETDDPPTYVPPPVGFQKARGNSDIPFSMFQGTIKFGEIEAECHVLSDLTRVFTQREVSSVVR